MYKRQEGIYEDILFFAKSLGVEKKGVDLVNSMKSKIEEIEEIGKSIENKKTCLLYTSRCV